MREGDKKVFGCMLEESNRWLGRVSTVPTRGLIQCIKSIVVKDKTVGGLERLRGEFGNIPLVTSLELKELI